MDEQGRLKWWSRCYHEWIDKNGNSTLDSGDVTTSSPDQYIDDLCIDYTAGQGGALVVVARCHGNNVINFWKGNEIKHSDNPKKAFQNQFTGSNGNIHISWIGRFSLDKEEIRHATFLAEVNEGQNPGGSYNDPLLDGWFNLNSGWAGLNTTKTVPNSAAVDAQGNVFVASMGRRTITTNNAYQQNLKPSEGKGCWNNFVRVYKKDLTLPVYSSLIVGQWNPQDGSGGGNTELQDVTSSAQGLIAVGYHTADTSGKANGNSIPTANVPSWGAQTPTGQTPFLAMLDFATALNPVLTPPSQTSIHTAIPRIKSITQSLRSLRITVSEGLVGKDLCLVTPQGRIVALAFDGTAYTANNLSAGMYYVSSKGGKFFIPVTFVNR
jgi:hypothetical protein